MAAIQMKYADMAPSYATTVRGQDVQTGTAAGNLANQLAGTQLGALTGQGAQMLGQGKLGLQQQEFSSDEQQRQYEMERDMLDRQMQRDQFGQTYNQNERGQQAGINQAALDAMMGNTLNMGDLLQQEHLQQGERRPGMEMIQAGGDLAALLSRR